MNSTTVTANQNWWKTWRWYQNHTA